jgi:hypothetical protein
MIASEGTASKVIVGTGWWACDEPSEWAIGAEVTRSVAFFRLWHRQVTRCLAPARIVVTDSHAPLKPDW